MSLTIFIIFFFLYLAISKIDFFKKTFYQSQTKIYKINNLVEKKWQSSRLSRVVSTFPHDNFHPNFAWVYGLATSDGWAHFVLNNYVSYWNYGVSKKQFIMTESYRNDQELFNLQCWALTAESFLNPDEWNWLYEKCGYLGDYEYIYFE